MRRVSWARHQDTFERGAALFALTAVGIAQPIFDVVSNSPEFFAARSTTRATAAAAVVAICVGIPLALLAIERVIRALSPRVAAVFFGMLLAVLSAAVMMPLLRRVEGLTFPWDLVSSAIVGVALAAGQARSRLVRQFMTALSPAALVVPLVFLLNPDVARAFLPAESAAAAQTIDRTPPIVFVVFDELPLNSLLDSSGEIDAGRYPHFAALAREALWFRDTSTVASTTSHAVPAILTGRYPMTLGAVPTLRYHPVNLFTALARHYDIFASLRFQQLCPPRACQYNSAMPADTVAALLSDLGFVWMHIVLPDQLADELPPVTEDWAEFGRPREARAEETRTRRHVAFAEFLASIDGRPARLHFIHLVLPHMPFEYVPSGRRYRGPDYGTNLYRGVALFERVSAEYADTLHQRHLAQVGFADRLIGDLLARLREAGIYDKAMVIVTADHGASYREGRSRRQLQRNNMSDVLRVPLLIKVPGRSGAVVDSIAETVDIFPTILDVIGTPAPQGLDGRSLVANQVPARSVRTFIMRSRVRTSVRTYGDLSADRAESLARKEGRFGRGDMTGLYAPPAARPLLGKPLMQSLMAGARDVRLTIRNPAQFAAVDQTRDPLPIYVSGTLTTSRAAPLTVAVTVNGIVAAVTQSYSERGAHTFGTLIPETTLRDGANVVSASVIDGVPR